ncbi:MAG: M23 family metallopeptidase [Anaerolineales bacterium]
MNLASVRKGRSCFKRRLLVWVCLISLAFRPPPASAARAADFSDWRWPVPAGEWAVSRGACGSPAPFDHQCNYYEERCAIDLVPTSGSMEDVPVLAPQAGQVFFTGARVDAGLALMLLHPDGRLSAFMHLSKIVVGLDEWVKQGQVIAYAGSSGSSGNPHLHFFVQPNAVERECLPLDGLDEINYVRRSVISHNLDWDELTLVDPPQALLDRLPPVAISNALAPVPINLILASGRSIRLPVLLTGVISDTYFLKNSSGYSTPVLRRTDKGALFHLPVQAPQRPGAARSQMYSGLNQVEPVFSLVYRVAQPVNPLPATDVLLTNPQFAGPNSYQSFRQPPELCWTIRRDAGQAPLEFRVVAAGPMIADSGWIGETCWQTPSLKAGTYYWKVFVRDAQGYMNRTNQRPYAFIVSSHQ